LYTDLCQSKNHVVIPSLAGFSLDSREWIDTLRFFEPLQPPCVQLDLFYLNEDLSLPDTQARLGTLMMRLRENCTLPLLPKLNQELRPGAALATFKHTGIAGWSLLDSIRTHLPSHPQAGDSGFPVFAHAQVPGSASLFGGWQLPLVSEYVYRLHANSPISIVAGGGVNQASDVVQLLALGAQAVQVATPVLVEGPAWIRRTLRDLVTATEIQAGPVASPQTFDRVRAHIDLAQCSGCGQCTEQLMCNAIRMTTCGPQIQPDRCEGCGFCLGLCANHAIHLHPYYPKPQYITEMIDGE
jgi:ferredoxin